MSWDLYNLERLDMINFEIDVYINGGIDKLIPSRSIMIFCI